VPGTNDRTPSDADRAPASRVGDELQQRADTDADPEEIEKAAIEAAEEKGWDQEQTAREGS
jgi:hypothetical protein